MVIGRGFTLERHPRGQDDSHDFVGRDVLEELGQLGVDPVEDQVPELLHHLVLTNRDVQSNKQRGQVTTHVT